METNTNKSPGKGEKTSPKKPKKGMVDKLIEKAEDKMDEAAEKLHQSEAYKKADKSLEEATKKLFRKAGKWWGRL